MKIKLTLILFLLVFAGFGQQTKPWDNWTWLIGEWKGEGTGQPGQGGGTFSFSYDLDKNIIVRKSHSEYAAKNKESKILHDDLMIIYLDAEKNPSKAIYFDNEAHSINYGISYKDKTIVLTSEKMQGYPVFRLTYTLIDKDLVNTKFEMSQDGINFMTYIEGKSRRR